MRSVKWPYEMNARGGLVLTDDSDQGRRDELRQLVTLAHIPGTPGNPYAAQADVVAPEGAFGVQGVTNARQAAHSQRFFARMERAGRARLAPGFPRVGSVPGKRVMQIEYQDLESGQPDLATATR